MRPEKLTPIKKYEFERSTKCLLSNVTENQHIIFVIHHQSSFIEQCTLLSLITPLVQKAVAILAFDALSDLLESQCTAVTIFVSLKIWNIKLTLTLTLQ